METGEGTRYSQLFEELDQMRQNLIDQVNIFPGSLEDYRRLPASERLNAAKAILRTYASVYKGVVDYKRHGEPATANIRADDRVGQLLSAEVYFSEAQTRLSGGYVHQHIGVNVRAYDPRLNITSKFVKLGELREGSYTDESGDSVDGWHVYVPQNNSTCSIDSSRGQDMIAFVDSAMTGLLGGRIIEQRHLLGMTALSPETT